MKAPPVIIILLELLNISKYATQGCGPSNYVQSRECVVLLIWRGRFDYNGSADSQLTPGIISEADFSVLT